MENEQVFTATPSTISVTAQAQVYLNIIRKWTKFFFILGFIFIGLMGIFAFAMLLTGALNSSGFSYLASLPYLLMMGIYFFPIFYLYRFCQNLDRALIHKSDLSLEKAFHNLKKHFQFVGIVCIVMMVVYPVILILLFSQMASSGFPGM